VQLNIIVNGKYTKEGDFLTESYEFEETTCKASINFEKVFRRFRGKFLLLFLLFYCLDLFKLA